MERRTQSDFILTYQTIMIRLSFDASALPQFINLYGQKINYCAINQRFLKQLCKHIWFRIESYVIPLGYK